jgi:hypothetical protein
VGVQPSAEDDRCSTWPGTTLWPHGPRCAARALLPDRTGGPGRTLRPGVIHGSSRGSTRKRPRRRVGQP